MRGPRSVNFHQGKSVAFILISLVCLSVPPVSTPAQTPAESKLQAKSSEKETSKVSEADSLDAERRAFALSLVTSLAEEARSYHDLALRPRVLARAADTLWDADSDTARTLFRRAWEAAEKGDAEEVTVKTKDNPPSMVIALRRRSGHDLRSEVLGIAARRNRILGEEFLAKLKDETEREAKDSKSSEAASKRLQLAGKLLEDGQIELALEFATPALDQVNANSIGFLSAVRRKNPEAADQRFAFLMARAEFDPSSDANTVSGLSSYAFTPGFYVAFSPDGGASWTQGDSVSTSPPNLPQALRNRFFQVGGVILLRPLPPPDQDSTSSGRAGKYMVIKRLLPLFDQYAPDTASALRAQLSALTADPLTRAQGDDSSLLVNGLRPEETGGNVLEKMLDRLDHAKTSRERDSIYADAAVTLANQGDPHAQDVADRIDDSDRRTQVRQYVDFEFVQRAIRKKEALEVARLAKGGQLTHTQRAWAYTQAARLLMNSQRQRAIGFLEEAADEARHVDGDDPDRTVLLIGVATQFITADGVRAWEIISEVVKAANATEKFTGEKAELTILMMATKSGVKFTRIGGKDFGLSQMLRSLTKVDLYRSVDLAKSFKNDAPRAVATLAIASAVLEK
ncbi:MAG TPA: hypothetical protein VGW76_16155 [Pyrinomonadaceae bacterium]|nr:hypothetical protein [Pyrinomonadaceae bacterium]